MKFFAVRSATVFICTLLLGASNALGQVTSRPVVSAGNNVQVYIGERAVLAGSATDPDNDPITGWAWAINSQPPGSNAVFLPDAFSQDVVLSTDRPGDYSLSLIAYDPNDGSLPAFVTVSVVVNQPPIAVATTDVIAGPAPLTVHFDSSGSFDREGSALVAVWTFGPRGPYASGPIATKVYSTSGTYSVSLTVIDERGWRTSAVVLITVTAPANDPPVASAAALPSAGVAPLAVAFAANTFDPEGGPLTYAWEFGDPSSANNTSAVASPSHTYNTAGMYVACVTVSDGSNSVSSSATIVIDDIVIPSLDFEVTSVKLKSKKHGTKSRLQVKGSFMPVTPGADDLIALVFDGREVFAAPYSSFVQAGHNDENQNKYKLKSGKTRVEVDMTKGRISVNAKRIDLAGLGGSSAVIELHIGTSVGDDSVSLEGHGDDHEHKDKDKDKHDSHGHHH